MPEVREQRLLKFVIRLLLPVFALGGFGSIAGLVFRTWSPFARTATVWSKDGKYRASIVEVWGQDGCGPGTTYAVLVERRSAYWYTGSTAAMCFAGPPENLTLYWAGPHDLAMTCRSCDHDSIYYDSKNWGQLHYRYDLGR